MSERPRPRQVLLVWGLTALLALILLYPVALTVRGGFAADPATGRGFTLEHLLNVFRDPVVLRDVGNSLRVAMTTTVLATLLAVPLALLGARYRFPLKGLFSAVILVPLILPPFVGAIGARAILGRNGALNALLGLDVDILGTAKFWGVVVVQALGLYPIIYLNATAALANLDPALEEAAENLGAGPWRRLFLITLPLIRPGLFAGATIVLIWSFTELGTPLMFDYYAVVPVRIFNGLKEVENSAEPYALTVVVLGVAAGMYVAGKYLLGRGTYAMSLRAARAGGERTLEGWRGWAAAGAFAAVCSLALVPHAGVVLTALSAPGAWYRTVLPNTLTLDHFREALAAPESFGAIVNSVRYSLGAVAVTLVLGVLIAYVLVRTPAPGRGLLDALCMLPLAVPGLVLAFGFVAASLRWPFGKDGPLGAWVSVVGATPNPVLLLIVAYAVRRLPYLVRSAVAGLQQTSGELEEAAINLGASRLLAVRKIVVPLIAANLIAGALLVFSFSMLEVSDSLILAQQSRHYPVTRAIFAFMERVGDGPHIAAAFGVWGMALLITTLAGASLMLGRRLGALFRV